MGQETRERRSSPYPQPTPVLRETRRLSQRGSAKGCDLGRDQGGEIRPGDQGERRGRSGVRTFLASSREHRRSLTRGWKPSSLPLTVPHYASRKPHQLWQGLPPSATCALPVDCVPGGQKGTHPGPTLAEPQPYCFLWTPPSFNIKIIAYYANVCVLIY